MFLILHGVANHRPPAHWQFQLAASLAAEGRDVRYPSLPSPDDPSPAAWTAAIQPLLDDVDTVICHSLGVEAWLGLGAVSVPRVLLVAPPGPEAMRANAPRFPIATPFAAPDGWEIWCSDADPYNATGAARTHGEPYGLPTRIFGGAGHFTPDDGYGVWPEVLNWARARR